MLDSLVRVSRRVLRVPKAVASPTGIGPRRAVTRPWGRERSQACRRCEPYDQQRARTGDGARSVNLRVPWRALATFSTHGALEALESCIKQHMRPDTLRVPPGSRPGDRGFDACRVTGDASVTAPGP